MRRELQLAAPASLGIHLRRWSAGCFWLSLVLLDAALVTWSLVRACFRVGPVEVDVEGGAPWDVAEDRRQRLAEGIAELVGQVDGGLRDTNAIPAHGHEDLVGALLLIDPRLID